MKNKIKEAFKNEYGSGADAVYFAPGRVNLIGEHLDYNGGYVLPYALKMGVYLAIKKNKDSVIRFKSASFEEEDEQSLFEPIEKKDKFWYNYPLGVCKYLLENRKRKIGFDFYFMSDLPIASGLSSSAAIEVVTAFALSDQLHINLNREKIAKVCLNVENDFVGMGCGIMDQMASALCEKDHCILLNCLNFSTKQIALELEDYEIVISHTGVSRTLDGSAFNTRRAECEQAVKELAYFFGHKYLCQYESDGVIFSLIKDKNARKRAKHVIKENERVLKAAGALWFNALPTLGKLMNQSHASLRDYYEVTGFELDTIVEEARKIEGVLGARMSGAGFGGCSINLVKKDKIKEFKSVLALKYKERTGLDIRFYSGASGSGVRKLA